jgi:hypothetical protein
MSQSRQPFCYKARNLAFDHALCYFDGTNYDLKDSEVELKDDTSAYTQLDGTPNPSKCMNLAPAVWMCAQYDDERAIAAHVLFQTGLEIVSVKTPPPETETQ